MPEKKVIRLTGGRKPKPVPPRLIIRKKGEAQEDVVEQAALVGRLPNEAPIEADTIMLGDDVDTGSPISATTKQLCSGTYVLGVQGAGRSSLLEQIVCQLMEQDESVIVFDPHGQLIDNIIRRMPAGRLRDTYHLDLKDREYPFALNVFACADPENEEERDRTRNRVMQAFEKLWPATQRGVYFKKLLRHIIILLIENPGLTLADMPRLLQDGTCRERYVSRLRNTGSRNFWEYDYGSLSPTRQHTEATPFLTRIDELLVEPVIERILCQPESTVNIRTLIENRQNLLISLPINEEAYSNAAGLVGTILMSLVYAATFSFAAVPEDERPGFSLIVDEFQNFATDDYAKLFSQGRKFRVKQFLAHQYRGQLSDATSADNRDATLTAGTKIVFRVAEPDSRALGPLFLDIGRSHRTVDLAIDPLDRLERHPNPVVKEFAAKYVWPLQAGTKDRMGTRKKFTWTFGDMFDQTVEEVPYERWRELMEYKCRRDYRINWSVRQEMRKHIDSPKEGRDYQVVPAYPERDFGAGRTLFSPEGLQKALQTLNTLLYETQKSGINCYGIENAKTQLSPEQYRVYRRHEQLAGNLEWVLAPMFRFDDWLIAWDKATNEQRVAMLDDAINCVETGRHTDLSKSRLRLSFWQLELQKCIDVLIREPIDQGGSDVRPADVAQSLQHLPLRQAFVRVGTDGHVMQTRPLTPGVNPDEEQQRRLQIRKQTRKTLCRYDPTVSGVREEAPASEEPVPAPSEPAKPQAPTGAGAPLIRRSRPLP